MIFSDPVFLLVFLPLTVGLHRLALKHSEALAQWLLIGASLVFYAVWNVRWLPLLAGTIGANILLGRALLSSSNKTLLTFGIVANLLPLAIVKYAGWLSGGYVMASIVLPLGISFFTFQQIAYLVDCYQKKVTQVEIRHYGLFVSFFPQLIAGPICHHAEMIKQFKCRYSLSAKQCTTALVLIAAGLIKKAVIADRLAPYADRVFDGSGVVSFYEAWVGSLAYTLQLLFDFAGYCEMAMGFALLFGYTLSINFNSPYKSRSITEFWRRWHITLGRFFKDYVYIPLGGNRQRPMKMYLALFFTAVVSGVWHGAGVTFILWGVLHGMALVAERVGVKAGFSVNPTLAWAVTFLYVSFAWVLFRSPDISTGLNIFASLLGLNGFVAPPLFATMLGLDGEVLGSNSGFEIVAIIALLWWVFTKPNVHEVDFSASYKNLAVMSGGMAVIILSITNPSSFIYFNF